MSAMDYKGKITHLFADYPKTDGIFASSDIIAAQVIHKAQKMSRLVPEDFRMAEFDDISIRSAFILHYSRLSIKSGMVQLHLSLALKNPPECGSANAQTSCSCALVIMFFCKNLLYDVQIDFLKCAVQIKQRPRAGSWGDKLFFLA